MSQTTNTDDPATAFAIALKALERIRGLGQIPDPPTFEVWFTYFQGHNQALVRDVDAAEAECLSRARVHSIRERHFSSEPHFGQFLSVGEALGSETRKVQNAIQVASGSAADYGIDLQSAAEALGGGRADLSVSELVKSLVRSTDAIQQTNALLQAQLKQSEDQFRLLQENMETLRLESMTDPLTRLANRKYFDFSLSQATTRAEDEDAPQPFSLAMIDIDRFKRFNDQFGHTTGDDVLRLVAFTLKNNVRASDLVARYGGDEFAVLLPNASLEEAMAIGDQIRKGVAERPLLRRATKETLGYVTLSIGVAAWAPGESAVALIERADRHLYEAKANGRNCLVGAPVRPS
ncbi:GGDEF domain-containing protein [Rhodoplanes sp. TEM]|uniref:GGDEF domain-containing protein n=1 Tax=Rhodoplanes TaxID=29407 RepID=UPI00234FD5B1|nr:MULTISPECIES: GGDEF domain-containing protein [Rhodoplanes]MDC7988135.1 GGDEF domain-containing protein [Rhodoplanes sp. TEM]MDQ0356100.1 diguanylate cyclase (GGDEF)-like protein [Rhodoplanes tepidamans]